MADLKTYRGNCHCKAHVFEVQMPEIKEVGSCNCSVCFKKGVLWGRIAKPGDLTWVKGGESTLADYSFGRQAFHHKFCPTCGVSLFVIGHLEPPKPGEEKDPIFALNVRTVQNLDVWSLATRPIDGAAFPPAYQPHEFTGPEPQGQVDGGKLYTGSCHCGKIKVAVRSKPLDETFEDRSIECNCSICGRYGAVRIYPKNEHVEIVGEENATLYKPGKGLFNAAFCKTCGVPVETRAAQIPAEQLAAMPEGALTWYNMGFTNVFINTRVLDGLDLEQLKKGKGFSRLDGWSNIPPAYENP